MTILFIHGEAQCRREQEGGGGVEEGWSRGGGGVEELDIQQCYNSMTVYIRPQCKTTQLYVINIVVLQIVYVCIESISSHITMPLNKSLYNTTSTTELFISPFVHQLIAVLFVSYLFSLLVCFSFCLLSFLTSCFLPSNCSFFLTAFLYSFLHFFLSSFLPLFSFFRIMNKRLAFKPH